MRGALLVLMWKHLMVRIKRFLHTPIELLSPIVLFIILYIFKDKINPVNKTLQLSDFNVHNTDILPLDKLEPPRKVYYIPETELTNLLMERVGSQLGLKRLKEGQAWFPGYLPLANEAELTKTAGSLEYGDAIVIFQNVNGTWPEKLNYTIRIKENLSFRIEPSLGSHENYGTVYNRFLRLQWAIDSTYLQLLTGNVIKQKVTVQEFPYAEAAQNETVGLIGILLIVISWLSLVLVFVFTASRLLEERCSGIQELIKMVGVSSNLISISHFLNVLPAGIIFSVVGTALLTASSNPLLRHTNPLLVAIMLLLHFVSIISLAFAFSYMLKSPQYVVSLASTVYVILKYPTTWIQGVIVPWWARPFSMLIPHAPMVCFWEDMVALELYGKGITFSNMAKPHSQGGVSVIGCYLFLVLQTAIFFSLAHYLSLVNPGPYGQALPWTFFCQKSYWSKRQVVPEEESEEMQEMEDEEDGLFFEPAPRNAEAGIKIINVSKVFGKKRALNNVNMDVYRGEITVLLGHNGAGKTTLMSIITGMLSPSEGQVYVEGLDTATQRNEMRQHLGLCPQHNLFFPDLTVLEHIIFFTMLKGIGYTEAKSSSLKLLEHLGLSPKLNEPSSALSGGMKRRLQLGCALAGDARLLVLDEPTAGLDVESRRQLWDLLTSLRGSRTVLLSTHFMEEADALGDRVAALHAGKLRCHATPMHLKRALGTGYRLTFTTIGLPNERLITEVVQSQIPDASVKETSMNSISYNLPAKDSAKFGKLFSTLEKKRHQLGIDAIGVGKSTLEEVFLKLCSDITTNFDDDEVDATTQEANYPKVTGLPLYLRQFSVLFKRQLKYLWSRKKSFIALQVILPILFICGVTYSINDATIPPDKQPAVAMNLDVYKDLDNQRVLYKVNETVSLRSVSDTYPKVDFERADDVASNVLRISKRDPLDFNKYLVGVELNETDAKILYTTHVHHAAPVAMNLLNNVLASKLLPWGDGATITTVNYPVYSVNMRAAEIVEPKDTSNTFLWASLIVFIIAATQMNSVTLACKERLTSTRHLHIMSGCPSVVYWLSTLVFQIFLYILTLLIPTIVACITLEKDNTLNQPGFLVILTLILILGMTAFLCFVFFVSFFFAERAASGILIAIIFVFGFLTPTMQAGAELIKDELPSYVHYLLTATGYIVPSHTFSMAVIRAGNVARINAFCDLNKDKCPNLIIPALGFDVKKCCELNTNPRSYFDFDEYAPAMFLIILFVQIVVYMAIVIALEEGYFMCLCDRLLNPTYTPKSRDDIDEIVRAERLYVNKAIDLPARDIQDAMLVDDVHKNYVRPFKKSCNAVKGVSFSVKKGECFGLLGVNGAGKSTTFKMLTATECPTRGRIFGNGYHMMKSRTEYLRSLGYCPQFFGLDAFLTGRDNLTLLLTLQGRDEEHIHHEVDSWIETVGLSKYADLPVSGYSGGCARRLSTAASLCGNAAVTLLDEPTAGVDVAARRRVWAALRRATACCRSLIITSHSMDEMEALCDRIAIMSAGEIRALGEAAVLRANHAAGHALTLKLTPASTDETDGSKSHLRRLKAALQERFDCTLKDEHKTMLQYHINDEIAYSELFTALEKLKDQFPLVEDYSVTETTLEEVFLSYAQTDTATPGPSEATADTQGSPA
ncbi:unnamed protein product [Leptosia nina]|uniref:ABC transporter domain-containing protein n=1 Tax=Leptosia nina TaxID=320188 RepID=A0AAV1JXP0_9NEOP